MGLVFGLEAILSGFTKSTEHPNSPSKRPHTTHLQAVGLLRDPIRSRMKSRPFLSSVFENPLFDRVFGETESLGGFEVLRVFLGLSGLWLQAFVGALASGDSAALC